MASRSLSTSTRVGGPTYTTPSLTNASSISTDSSARCRSDSIIHTLIIPRCSAISFVRQGQSRQLGRLLGRLRGVCGDLWARVRFAPAGALSFHRGWRNGSRELFEGGDGLEGTQEHGGGPRRARHPDFAFPPRLSRTQRLYDEPHEYGSAQDRFVRQVRLAARVMSAHRLFVARIGARSRCDCARTESRARNSRPH